jgi:hypothetical protein
MQVSTALWPLNIAHVGGRGTSAASLGQLANKKCCRVGSGDIHSATHLILVMRCVTLTTLTTRALLATSLASSSLVSVYGPR